MLATVCYCLTADIPRLDSAEGLNYLDVRQLITIYLKKFIANLDKTITCDRVLGCFVNDSGE